MSEEVQDYKYQAEALLFSAGKSLEVEFMTMVMGVGKDVVKNSLIALKKDYEEKDSSLMVVEEKDAWKITVREKYLPLVRKIVADTELSTTVMETLAVIAWKSPVLQSEVIHIRTNKAYDHIGELLDAGFLTKEKHGRSFMLKVTNKFYEYFDVEGTDGIREVFSKIKETPAQKKVDEFPEKVGGLDVVDAKPDTSIEDAEKEAETERLGKLEVFEEEEGEKESDTDDEPSNEEGDESGEESEKIPEPEAVEEETQDSDDETESDNEEDSEEVAEADKEEETQETNDTDNESTEENAEQHQEEENSPEESKEN